MVAEAGECRVFGNDFSRPSASKKIMKSLIDELKETIDRPLESFLDNVDSVYQSEKDRIASQEEYKWEEKHGER